MFPLEGSLTYCVAETAMAYGVLAVGAAFLAGNLGGVLQTAVAVTSSVSGPLLAAFVMALFMPFTNAKVSQQDVSCHKRCNPHSL